MNSLTLNINIGLLGHVDSGKTSLAKCLTEICSTACFDKHPQSQERGITIDLGFSSFSIEATENLKKLDYQKIQFTLVDCPGHASLIRTIIGGVHIIDLVILVIDVNKGIQTQTAECLVISQITKKPLMVALNKIDSIDPNKKDEFIKKATKKLEQTLSDTFFKTVPIIPIIAKEDYSGDRGINNLIEELRKLIFVPNRLPKEPLVLALDHCFLIKGKGTILTGTVLQGTLKINDDIEIPLLKETKKVKSIQMFKKNVLEAMQGDRIGICVKQFEPSLLERGLACSPGYIPLLYGVIISFNKVKYFKGSISSNNKFHISIGHETVMGKIKLFSSLSNEEFSLKADYAYIEKYADDIHSSGTVFALIEFDKSLYVAPESIVIASKLDVSIDSKVCRLAFYGNIIKNITDKNYVMTLLPELKLFIVKEKNGIAHNAINETEIIVLKLCKKHTSIQKFLNFKVELSTGEIGYIQSSFGQKDKVRIIIPNSLKQSTYELLSRQRKTKTNNLNSIEKAEKKDQVRITLKFKKYLFDKEKNVSQNGLY